MDRESLGPLGARVTDLPLASVTPGTLADLRRLLAVHGVLVFPAQDEVDDDVFAGFMRNFGGFNPLWSVGHHLGHPPAYNALRMVNTPVGGAQTLFTNQYRAFETLPGHVRDWLLGRTVRHTDTDRSTGLETVAEHPIFFRHPLSGRIALHLSAPLRRVAITGLPDDVATETIAYLLEHSSRSGNTLRHRWSSGDIVVWDNRCVLHMTEHDADTTGWVQSQRTIGAG